MGLTGCYAVMKCLIFFLNLIFWLTGLFIISLSVWMLTDPTFYVSMAQDESSYYSGIYVLLAVGILLFIVGFLGCCGTIRESQVMLVLFFCVLLIIMVAEISAAAWAYSKSDELEQVVRESVKNTVRDEYGHVDIRTKTFDTIQKELGCCGVNGPEDWLGSKFNQGKSLDFLVSAIPKQYKVPTTCCTTEALANSECDSPITATQGDTPSHLIYHQGCTDRLMDTLRAYRDIILIVGILIGIAQLSGLIFSLILCCAIHQNDHYYKA